MVQEATEKDYKEKLFNHHSQHSSFGKSKPLKDQLESDFDIFHYAGIVMILLFFVIDWNIRNDLIRLLNKVSYRADGWLEKNRDHVNQTVAMLLKNSRGNKVVSAVFQDIGIEESKYLNIWRILWDHMTFVITDAQDLEILWNRILQFLLDIDLS